MPVGRLNHASKLADAAAVPPVQRKSRQELATIANHYFEVIENDDGKGYYPFTDDCDRLGTAGGQQANDFPTGSRMHIASIHALFSKEA